MVTADLSQLRLKRILMVHEFIEDNGEGEEVCLVIDSSLAVLVKKLRCTVHVFLLEEVKKLFLSTCEVVIASFLAHELGISDFKLSEGVASDVTWMKVKINLLLLPEVLQEA